MDDPVSQAQACVPGLRLRNDVAAEINRLHGGLALADRMQDRVFAKSVAVVVDYWDLRRLIDFLEMVAPPPFYASINYESYPPGVLLHNGKPVPVPDLDPYEERARQERVTLAPEKRKLFG